MKIGVSLLLLASTCVAGADITFRRGTTERLEGYSGVVPETWLPRIVIAGPILAGDDRRFAEVLERAQKQTKELDTVLLDSQGGDVGAAMSIGRMVRGAKLYTGVHESRVCASACILILAGGVRRYARETARLGLHRPYFSDPSRATAKGYETFQQAYESVIEAHRVYFSEMKISNGLLDRMLQIPSSEIQWISVATASGLNLLGEDASYAEWQRARRIATEGQACVDWMDNRYIPCQVKLGFHESERCMLLTKRPKQCK
jgi:hypothetical protein